MATLSPTPQFNVATGGTQEAPSTLSALSGLLGGAAEIAVSGLTSTGGEPSAAQSDELLYTEFARQLGRANDLRVQGRNDEADRLESRVATEFIVRGGDLNDSRATGLITQMTGRPEGYTLGMSEQQYMLQQAMSDPAFQTQRLATYASHPDATEEQRNQIALDAMARQEAVSTAIVNQTYDWNTGGESMYNAAIADFNNVLMGGVAAAERRDGTVRLQDVQEAKAQFNQFRVQLVRPTNLSADEWAPIQEQLDNMQRNLDYLEEISGPNNISARMVGDLLQTIENSDNGSVLERTVLGLAIKDNPSMFFEQGIISNEETQRMMRALDIPSNNISSTGLSNPNRWPATDFSEVAPQDVLSTAQDQLRVSAGMNLESPEGRELWGRTVVEGLSGMKELGRTGEWLTSDQYDTFFNDAFFQNLEDVAATQPELAEAIRARALSVVQQHGQTNNARLQSIYRDAGFLVNPSTGSVSITEESLRTKLATGGSPISPDETSSVLSAIDEHYGGNYQAFVGDYGQRLIDNEALGFDSAGMNRAEYLSAHIFGDMTSYETDLIRTSTDLARLSAQLSVGMTEDQLLGAEVRHTLEQNPSSGITTTVLPPATQSAITGNTEVQGAQGGDYLGSSGANALVSLVDSTEGAGNYDTLFGHSQREGRPFAGVRVSQMTLGELAEFTDVNGAYGQWVKGELGRSGHRARVATPMGRYQFVGTTLRATARAMGLPDDTVFSPEVQDAMFLFKVNERLEGETTAEGRRNALRAEWEGFKHVSDAELDAAIQGYLSGDPVDLDGIVLRAPTQRDPESSVVPDIRPYVAPEVDIDTPTGSRSTGGEAVFTSVRPQAREDSQVQSAAREAVDGGAGSERPTASQAANRELAAKVVAELAARGNTDLTEEEVLAILESREEG